MAASGSDSVSETNLEAPTAPTMFSESGSDSVNGDENSAAYATPQ